MIFILKINLTYLKLSFPNLLRLFREYNNFRLEISITILIRISSKSWFTEFRSSTTKTHILRSRISVLHCCRCLSTLCMRKLHGNVGSRNPIFQISPSIIITLSPRSSLLRCMLECVAFICFMPLCTLHAAVLYQQRLNGRKQRYYYLTEIWKYAEMNT